MPKVYGSPRTYQKGVNHSFTVVMREAREGHDNRESGDGGCKLGCPLCPAVYQLTVHRYVDAGTG
jgi:hypothetical protein